MAGKKRKICIVTGNRAEYSKVKTVLKEIKKHPDLELQLVVTGAHLLRRYGLSIEEITGDGFKVNEKVYFIVEGENPMTMAKSVGLGIVELSTAFNQLKPDVVIVPTDRFETLSAAVAASLMNICVIHIEGGEITGTIDESIRHTITKLSHIHFPANEQARKRIIKMGERKERVFNVGCPAIDLVIQTPKMKVSKLFSLPEIIPKDKHRRLDSSQPYLLVIQHPVTTEYGHGFKQIQETLHALKDIGMQAIMLWPNPDAGSQDVVLGIRQFLLEYGEDNFFLYRHFSTHIFINLMYNCACMVGNSSAGIRETCYYGVPTVDIGTRQQDRQRGRNVINVGHDRKMIKQAILHQLKIGRYPKDKIYGSGQAGKKIADILRKTDIRQIQKKLSL